MSIDYRLFWGQLSVTLVDNRIFWDGVNSDPFWDVALSLPASPTNFNASKFSLEANTQIFVSPQSGATQTLLLPGAKWRGSFELPKMTRADASLWCAFLAELMGRSGRFYVSDPNGKTPRGIGSSTPGTVTGAGQTGRSLYTSGWDISTTGLLLAGDYVAWRTPTGWMELHQLATNIDSGPYGDAVLSFSSPIRESPTNGATIIYQNAQCIMQLDSDNLASWDVDTAMHYGITFNAVEAFS